MSPKRKNSLPRLLTTIPLLEKPSNASYNLAKTTPNAIIPDRPARSSSLLEDQHDDENIAPITSDYRLNVAAKKNMEDIPVTKVKIPYYENAFTLRGSNDSPKERVTFESVVVVELKTNTKLKDDEDTPRLLSEFSQSLAQIYQRPQTSILVTINQKSNILFGTSHGHAYLLKVSALTSLIAPLTNSRNANLIQSMVHEIFDIPPDMGVVIFNPMGESNLGTNGKTARDEIDRLERSDQNPSIFKSISRSMSRRKKTSSGTSAPLSLGTIMSPDVSNAICRSPDIGTSADSSPFQSLRPDSLSMGDLTKVTSPGEDSSNMGLPKRTLSKDDKGERSLKKRESLKSFVNRRLIELGEKSPFKTPKQPPKGKQD